MNKPQDREIKFAGLIALLDDAEKEEDVDRSVLEQIYNFAMTAQHCMSPELKRRVGNLLAKSGFKTEENEDWHRVGNWPIPLPSHA